MIIINKNDIILLKCISKKLSLSILKSRGLSYAQIAMRIQKLIKSGFLKYDDDDIIVLTEFGEAQVSKYDNSISDKEQKWIFPQYDKYTEPLDSSEIVLPKNKTVLK